MSEHAHREEQERTPGVFHESEAFAFGLILKVGIGLAVVSAVVCVAVAWLLSGLEKHHTVPPGRVSELMQQEAAQPLSRRVESVPAPHLEGIERGSNSRSIAAARHRAEVQMEQYGWIDREKGIVHVPVEKAMEEVLRSKEFGSAGSKKKMGGGKR
jgi:hypothetical protein